MKSEVWAEYRAGLLNQESVEDSINKGKVEYLAIRDTTIRLRKTFFPADLNHHGPLD